MSLFRVPRFVPSEPALLVLLPFWPPPTISIFLFCPPAKRETRHDEGLDHPYVHAHTRTQQTALPAAAIAHTKNNKDIRKSPPAPPPPFLPSRADGRPSYLHHQKQLRECRVDNKYTHSVFLLPVLCTGGPEFVQHDSMSPIKLIPQKTIQPATVTKFQFSTI